MHRSLSLAILLAACAAPAEVDEAPVQVGNPSVRITEPARASFLAEGPTVLRGTATDLVAVDVTPAGGVISPGAAAHVPAQLSGSQFEADATALWGINTYEALGTDAGGDTWLARRSVMAGTYAPADGPVEQAAFVRIEQDALDALSGVVEGALDPAQLSRAMQGSPAVFEESFGVLGLDAVTLSASVGSIDFDPPTLGLDPLPGKLDLELLLPSVAIELPVDGSIVGIGFDTSATVGCDRAVVTAQVRLGTDGSGGLDIEVLQPAIDLQGFWYDVSLLPGDALEGLFTDSLQGILEAELLTQVEAGLPGLLDAALAGLHTPTEVPFLDTRFTITPSYRTALIDDQGLGLILDFDVAVPIAGTKTAPGYLHRGGSLPPVAGTDLGLVVSDDFVNRVLHELWAGGVLDLTIDSDEGLIDPAIFEELGGTEGGRLVLDAQLPAVLVQRDGKPRLQVGEWLLRAETPNGVNGEYVVFACALEAAVDLSVEGGVLYGVVADPQVSYVVRDTDWTARHETITRVVEGSLPVEELLDLLGTLAFPLPAIGGFQLDDAIIDRDASGASTTLSLDL